MNEPPAVTSVHRSVPASVARGYLLIVLGIALGALVSVVAVTLPADPYGTHPGFAAEALRGHQTTRGTRTWKAEAIARTRPRTVILGSSRSEVGLDPEHGGFGNDPAFNASLAGTNFFELQEMFRHVRAQGRLRRLVLSVDFLLFNDARTTARDFLQSRLNRELDPVEYRLSTIVSQRAAYESLRQLWWYAQGRPAEVTERGWRDWGSWPPPRTTRRRFESTLRRFASSPALYADYTLSPDRLRRFGDVVGSCVADEIEIVVIIPPPHALQLLLLDRVGIWHEFESWKRQLTRIVEETVPSEAGRVMLLDFTGFNDLTTEPVPPAEAGGRAMKWFWDPSHLTRRLGDAVLREALTGEPWGSGAVNLAQRLTPTNIERHLARQRDDRDRFVATNPGGVALVEAAVADPPPGADSSAMP